MDLRKFSNAPELSDEFRKANSSQSTEVFIYQHIYPKTGASPVCSRFNSSRINIAKKQKNFSKNILRLRIMNAYHFSVLALFYTYLRKVKNIYISYFLVWNSHIPNWSVCTDSLICLKVFSYVKFSQKQSLSRRLSLWGANVGTPIFWFKFIGYITFVARCSSSLFFLP